MHTPLNRRRWLSQAGALGLGAAAWPALAQQAANESGASQRLKIHSAAPLAPGWTGKLWALNEGISATSEKGVEFFWFTDADIEHAPDTLRRLVFRSAWLD